VIENRLNDVDNKITSLVNEDKRLNDNAVEIDNRLGGRLNGVDGDINQLRDEDTTLNTKIIDTETRLSDRIGDGEVAHEQLKERVARIESTLNGFAAAQSISSFNLDGNASTSTAMTTEAKDLLIVCLLIFNIGTILGCISCLFWSKQQKRTKGHVYDGVIDYDEESRLQK